MRNFYEEIGGNRTFWVAILSWFMAQFIKILINLYKTKKLDIYLLFSSGGMPSSHSSFVTATATSVGIIRGFDTIEFAICTILSMIVMYDAQGVRRQAGTHAQYINTIIKNVENSGVVIDKKLKELLGHSPIEVFAGAILGILIAVILVR